MGSKYRKHKRRKHRSDRFSVEEREEVRRQCRRRRSKSGQYDMDKRADANNIQALASDDDRKEQEQYRLQARYQALKDAEPSTLPCEQYTCKFDGTTAAALGSGKTLTNGLRPVGPSQALKILQTAVNDKYDTWRAERKFKELCKEAGISPTPDRRANPSSQRAAAEAPVKELSAEERREQRRLLMAKIRDFLQRQKQRNPFRDRTRFDETAMPMRGW